MSKTFMPGGLPPQTQLHTQRAVFTDAYAFIPAGVQRDIVTSFLPHWTGMRMWVLARPLSGFAETFSQYLVEVEAGGGSETPEADEGAEAVIFVTSGSIELTIDGSKHPLAAGDYAYLSAGSKWTLNNNASEKALFHWVRKKYQDVDGLEAPPSFVTKESDADVIEMPETDGGWATTRFVKTDDMRHDMHVNIVTLQPGAMIPFEETHVMEHGLYVLEGKAVYKLNQDWVEVEAGDFMWLRAFCPQACYAGGPGLFRYLLYKDVNRHSSLDGVLR